MPRDGLFVWTLLLITQSAISQPECDSSEAGSPKCAVPGEPALPSSLLQQASVRSSEEDKAASFAGEGAQWTQDEALIVMSKLHQLLKGPYTTVRLLEAANGPYDCTTGFDEQGPQPCDGRNGNHDGDPVADLPTAAKLLRLGFHDCMKYTDGSGGCDGCLKFYDQFRKYNDLASGDKRRLARADAVSGSNNGLAMTADALELIYTDKDFPPRAPSLSQSLQETGKSRADLWAFATLVGTDWAMSTNNAACRNEGRCGHIYNEIPGLPFSCEIEPRRWLQFKTGRRDCPAHTKPTPNQDGYVTTMNWELPQGHRYRAYETTTDEQQPNPHGDSWSVRNYFSDVFDFKIKETVAIMGAHALGEMHGSISLFKYQWQFKQHNYLNNNYYRLLLDKPTYFIGDCSDPYFFVTGGPNGAFPQTSWAVRPIRKSVSSGPFMWFHLYTRCPSCYRDATHGGWVNVETEGTSVFRTTECCECNVQHESQVAEGCLQDVTKDEIMMPVDMALLANFSTDQTVPYGCSGFPQNWNRQNLVEQATGVRRHRLDFYKTVPNCPENTVQSIGREGTSAPTMADWVHNYADNQNWWANDFYDALEKMLSNGYGDSLRDGPDVLGIERAVCPGDRRWTGTCRV